MKTSQSRLFAAVPIHHRVRHIIDNWHKPFKTVFAFQKWVHPEDYHITLKFLGDTDISIADQIRHNLKGVAENTEHFPLAIDKLGVFGPVRAPQILWAGISGDLHALIDLQKNTETALTALGFPSEDRKYRPHLTLARRYQGNTFDTSALDAAILPKEADLTWLVDEIVLYESHLGRQPMYQAVEAFPLSR